MDYTSLNYNHNYLFNTDEIEQFYRIYYALTYSYPLKKNWRLTARVNPTMASNLKGKLSSEDILFNGGVLATKRWGNFKKGSSLTFGVVYATLSGKPGVIPIVGFSQKLSNRFSYTIGFPSTFFNYNLNAKHSFRIGIKQQGFYTNISGDNSPVINGEEAQKVQFRNFLANLDYKYKLTKTWSLNTSVGYSFSNTYSLLDADKDELYDFNINNRPFFSIGISYNIMELMKSKQAKNK